MEDLQRELAALARHLSSRRGAILAAWQSTIKRDPALTTGEPLPRVQLLDHIPSMLATFERALYHAPGDAVRAGADAGQEPAAAHGLQRWRQGYDLREVTRELGKLNECVVAELDAYTAANPAISHAGVATARRVWAAMCSTGIEESVGQFFELQQQEAAGHVKDLESALSEIRELEQQRGDLWRQAAHDLRGNLGVVANATVGLAHKGLQESSRDDFVGILMRSITSLHHLLDDVTSLARLQAGREHRSIEPLDVTQIVQQLCEGIRPLAQQRRLFLRCEGPAGFAAEGDPVKIRRIAQNLILNAVKATSEGGITVSWGDSDDNDPKRWVLCIQDTGPGFHTSAGKPLAEALDVKSNTPQALEAAKQMDTRAETPASGTAAAAKNPGMSQNETGEGIGLSIVKRLCDMLDATVEMQSVTGVGTTFRIRFPREYSE
ncbi:MAG: HAMP domain-containing sensor histidine kinase [Steroidobacteraceae bacterium]|jgi:signal transduction histidine kinase